MKGGDLVDDISVKGVVKKDGKTLAVVSDSRGMVRWLPVGFKFRDGMIAAIDDNVAALLRQGERTGAPKPPA